METQQQQWSRPSLLLHFHLVEGAALEIAHTKTTNFSHPILRVEWIKVDQVFIDTSQSTSGQSQALVCF